MRQRKDVIKYRGRRLLSHLLDYGYSPVQAAKALDMPQERAFTLAHHWGYWKPKSCPIDHLYQEKQL
jgi:hypothetical protein